MFMQKQVSKRKPGSFNKLAIKIPLVYFLIILMTVLGSYAVLNQIASHTTQEKVNAANTKTIASIKANCDYMIENIDNYSKMMLSDVNLQSLLRKGDVYANLQTQAKVTKYFYNLMQTEPIIDSVEIFDNSENYFSVGQQTYPTLKKE